VGAVYVHQLWDYGKDTILLYTWGWRWWPEPRPIWPTAKVFVIERRVADDDHQHILLVPVATWYGVAAWLVSRKLGDNLCRSEYVTASHVVFDRVAREQRVTCLAPLDSYASACVPTGVFDAVTVAYRNAAVKPTVPTIQMWIPERATAAVVLDYLRSVTPPQRGIVYSAEDGVRQFTFVTGDDESGKPVLAGYMSPLMPAAFVPTKSLSNERAGVVGRVERPGVHASQTPPATKFLLRCMEEFATCMFPEEHTLVPFDVDEVYLRQDRPTQRAILDRAEMEDPYSDKTLQTFVKAEAYQSVKEPRIITTYPGGLKREYSRYLYAVADFVVHHCKWYAFGKPPVKLASLVAKICVANDAVDCNDCIRMDGHISEIVRQLELVILYRAFRREHCAEVAGLHARQYARGARTRGGYSYDIEFQRGSGSSETALFNSMLSKFIDFLAWRLAGAGVQAAYDKMGLFGGDDTFNEPNNHTTAAADMLGQRMELVRFKRGEPGVNFLARIYTREVWEGNPASMCDLARTLSKLHVAPNLPGVTPVMKLQQKLLGLCVTDPNTPIIREILVAALQLGLKVTEKIDPRLVSWWARYPADSNWPNNGDFSDELARQLPRAQPGALYEHLNWVSEWDDMLKMPAIVALEDVQHAPVPGVVVDDNRAPPLVVSTPPAAALSAAGRLELCHDYVQGRCRKRPCDKEHVKVCRDYYSGKCERREGKCRFPHRK